MRSTMPGRRADNGPVRARRPARGSRPCLTSTSWSSARDRRGEWRGGEARKPPRGPRAVRPGARLPPMPDVDVLVVGAGPAGAVAAWEAKQAARELDVVLVVGAGPAGAV